MYKQIEGFISAEEAADELVRHAQLIADGVKRGENIGFEIRVAGVNALTTLLNKYVTQLRANYGKEEGPAILDLCQAQAKTGDRVGAIRRYRNETGVSLREAKELVLGY